MAYRKKPFRDKRHVDTAESERLRREITELEDGLILHTRFQAEEENGIRGIIRRELGGSRWEHGREGKLTTYRSAQDLMDHQQMGRRQKNSKEQRRREEFRGGEGLNESRERKTSQKLRAKKASSSENKLGFKGQDATHEGCGSILLPAMDFEITCQKAEWGKMDGKDAPNNETTKTEVPHSSETDAFDKVDLNRLKNKLLEKASSKVIDRKSFSHQVASKRNGNKTSSSPESLSKGEKYQPVPKPRKSLENKEISVLEVQQNEYKALGQTVKENKHAFDKLEAVEKAQTFQSVSPENGALYSHDSLHKNKDGLNQHIVKAPNNSKNHSMSQSTDWKKHKDETVQHIFRTEVPDSDITKERLFHSIKTDLKSARAVDSRGSTSKWADHRQSATSEKSVKRSEFGQSTRQSSSADVIFTSGHGLGNTYPHIFNPDSSAKVLVSAPNQTSHLEKYLSTTSSLVTITESVSGAKNFDSSSTGGLVKDTGSQHAEKPRVDHAVLLDHDVYCWLQNLGLQSVDRYVDLFSEHQMDMESVRMLTASGLRDMGIHALGPIMKIIKGVQVLERDEQRQEAPLKSSEPTSHTARMSEVMNAKGSEDATTANTVFHVQGKKNEDISEGNKEQGDESSQEIKSGTGENVNTNTLSLEKDKSKKDGSLLSHANQTGKSQKTLNSMPDWKQMVEDADYANLENRSPTTDVNLPAFVVVKDNGKTDKQAKKKGDKSKTSAKSRAGKSLGLKATGKPPSSTKLTDDGVSSAAQKYSEKQQKQRMKEIANDHVSARQRKTRDEMAARHFIRRSESLDRCNSQRDKKCLERSSSFTEKQHKPSNQLDPKLVNVGDKLLAKPKHQKEHLKEKAKMSRPKLETDSQDAGLEESVTDMPRPVAEIKREIQDILTVLQGVPKEKNGAGSQGKSLTLGVVRELQKQLHNLEEQLMRRKEEEEQQQTEFGSHLNIQLTRDSLHGNTQQPGHVDPRNPGCLGQHHAVPKQSEQICSEQLDDRNEGEATTSSRNHEKSSPRLSARERRRGRFSALSHPDFVSIDRNAFTNLKTVLNTRGVDVMSAGPEASGNVQAFSKQEFLPQTASVFAEALSPYKQAGEKSVLSSSSDDIMKNISVQGAYVSTEGVGTSTSSTAAVPGRGIVSGHTYKQDYLSQMRKQATEHFKKSNRFSGNESNFASPMSNVKKVEIDPKDITYSENDLLGEGAFSQVFKGIYQGSEVAVKRLQTPLLMQDTNYFKAEVMLLQELRHPHVVMLLGVCTKDRLPLVLLELMPCGNLYSRLHDVNKPRLVWEEYRQIAHDVSSGMLYLHHHSPPVLHLDLKPRNVLLGHENRAKIADFGFSKFKHEADTKVSRSSKVDFAQGTPAWIAPELLSAGEITAKADVYSFGVVLWEMLTRQTPYQGCTVFQVLERIRLNKRPALPTNCPSDLARLIQKCWVHNPAARPAFKEVLRSVESLSVPSEWATNIEQNNNADQPGLTAVAGTVPLTSKQGSKEFDHPQEEIVLDLELEVRSLSPEDDKLCLKDLERNSFDLSAEYGADQKDINEQEQGIVSPTIIIPSKDSCAFLRNSCHEPSEKTTKYSSVEPIKIPTADSATTLQEEKVEKQSKTAESKEETIDTARQLIEKYLPSLKSRSPRKFPDYLESRENLTHKASEKLLPLRHSVDQPKAAIPKRRQLGKVYQSDVFSHSKLTSTANTPANQAVHVTFKKTPLVTGKDCEDVSEHKDLASKSFEFHSSPRNVAVLDHEAQSPSNSMIKLEEMPQSSKSGKDSIKSQRENSSGPLAQFMEQHAETKSCFMKSLNSSHPDVSLNLSLKAKSNKNVDSFESPFSSKSSHVIEVNVPYKNADSHNLQYQPETVERVNKVSHGTDYVASFNATDNANKPDDNANKLDDNANKPDDNANKLNVSKEVNGINQASPGESDYGEAIQFSSSSEYSPVSLKALSLESEENNCLGLKEKPSFPSKPSKTKMSEIFSKESSPTFYCETSASKYQKRWESQASSSNLRQSEHDETKSSQKCVNIDGTRERPQSRKDVKSLSKHTSNTFHHSETDTESDSSTIPDNISLDSLSLSHNEDEEVPSAHTSSSLTIQPIHHRESKRCTTAEPQLQKSSTLGTSQVKPNANRESFFLFGDTDSLPFQNLQRFSVTDLRQSNSDDARSHPHCISSPHYKEEEEGKYIKNGSFAEGKLTKSLKMKKEHQKNIDSGGSKKSVESLKKDQIRKREPPNYYKETPSFPQGKGHNKNFLSQNSTLSSEQASPNQKPELQISQKTLLSPLKAEIQRCPQPLRIHDPLKEKDFSRKSSKSTQRPSRASSEADKKDHDIGPSTTAPQHQTIRFSVEASMLMEQKEMLRSVAARQQPSLPEVKEVPEAVVDPSLPSVASILKKAMTERRFAMNDNQESNDMTPDASWSVQEEEG